MGNPLQRSQIDHEALGLALQSWIDREHGMSRALLAARAGVDVSVVSRAVNGNYRLVSKAISRVLNESKIDPTTYLIDCDPAKNRHLMSAIRGVWNGTPEHARALASVIKSLNRLIM